MSGLPVLILAAGAARRMRGRDKLAEHVAGEPLLRRLARFAGEVGEVFVALPRPDHPRAALLDGLAATVLGVPDSAEGMSGSLRGAVAQLPEGASFLLVLGDLPEITAEDMARVAATEPGILIRRGATEDLRPGHPILFDASLRAEFATLTGDGGGAPIVKRHRDRTRLVPLPGQRALRDLDTPEDWSAFRTETGL